MHNFDLQAHLQNIYASFPQAKRQPIIGLTANFRDDNAILMDRYYRQVVDAGGTPVLIPPVDSVDVIVNTLDHIDALILKCALGGRRAFAAPTFGECCARFARTSHHPIGLQPPNTHPGHLSWHANDGRGTRRKGGARHRRTFY